MATETADVPKVSRMGGNSGPELIDSQELAARWQVPESWIRNHTRERTPKDHRIPCIRLGRYVRFEWGSPRLQQWLDKQRQ
jgi:hypothetical protein